jgi:hypothetical protein
MAEKSEIHGMLTKKASKIKVERPFSRVKMAGTEAAHGLP